ncbi:MAG: hypothetical protein AUK51_00200 [Comamonadaceae bacterium CG2_30_59_20]|nr:MAG: hypothetical protein AUK51_00200 [Comamonadaceae bacterium CG2_30_59_20]
MFNANLRVREDTRKAYPERRFVGYNTIAGRLMVVVFCCPTLMRTHIISFRKANDVNNKNLKLKASEAAPAIDWAAVNAAPMASMPDEDSPELTATQAAQLRALIDMLPAFSTGKTVRAVIA